jgi:adenylate cyclase
LDKIRVVGKHVPVTVYELLGTLSEPEDNRVAKFAAALVLYRAHSWEEAEKYFASILDEFPEDKPSKIYLERCEYYRNNPPPMDWDGVFNRVDK